MGRVAVLLIVVSLASASPQGPPPAEGNSHRVGDILTSLGKAIQSAVSCTTPNSLNCGKKYWLLFLPLQTKKGKNSLQVAAMSEMMTQWLLDLKQRGLATDHEVHLATRKGIIECVCCHCHHDFTCQPNHCASTHESIIWQDW